MHPLVELRDLNMASKMKKTLLKTTSNRSSIRYLLFPSSFSSTSKLVLGVICLTVHGAIFVVIIWACTQSFLFSAFCSCSLSLFSLSTNAFIDLTMLNAYGKDIDEAELFLSLFSALNESICVSLRRQSQENIVYSTHQSTHRYLCRLS
jgi:hypothetical protein